MFVCVSAGSLLSKAEQRVHTTDHSITAHFPAHYQQQGRMGAYNEGPCLGPVMGEHSPDSVPPSSAPFLPPPPCYTNIYPQRFVILYVLSLLLSSHYPSPTFSSSCLFHTHLVCLPFSSLLMSFHCVCLLQQQDSTHLSLLLCLLCFCALPRY